MTEQPASNRIISIVVGLILGLGAQIIILPIAIFSGLFIVNSAATATLSQTDIAVRDVFALGVFLGAGVLLEVAFVALVFVLARSVRQIGLFQGSLIGAIIGLLLYTGCWSIFIGGMGG